MKNNIFRLLIVLLVASLCATFCHANLLAENLQVKTIYSSVNVYESSSTESNVLTVLSYGTVLNVVLDDVLGEDGHSYVQVEITGDMANANGYVLKSQVLNVEYFSPQKELDHNATLAKESYVFTLNVNNYEQTDIILEKDTKIKILSGYNTANEYTQIQYKNENGDIVTAYVKTANIKTSGISRTLIGAVLIVVTTVSLVLIIFGIKGKKKKII